MSWWIIVILALAIGTAFYFMTKPSENDRESGDQSLKKSVSECPQVCYYSRKHGWRNGYQVGTDSSGRCIVKLLDHPDGVFVKRQPHLVETGWKSKRSKKSDFDPTAAYLIDLERRLEVIAGPEEIKVVSAAGYGAVGNELPERFEEFNIRPF